MKHKDKLNHDIHVLTRFIQIYCDKKHTTREKSSWRSMYEEIYRSSSDDFQLCYECRELLGYSIKKDNNVLYILSLPVRDVRSTATPETIEAKLEKL